MAFLAEKTFVTRKRFDNEDPNVPHILKHLM
jgi:hypothetical protein